MRNVKWMAGSCFAMVLALLAWGCAGKAQKAVPFEEIKGQHPANWIQVHYSSYIATPEQCQTCHGSTTDSALAGGISKVSCFTCHTGGVNHPAGWAAPAQHGLAAKQAPSANPIAMVGFSHCAKCHGATYAGGVANSCKACHTKAPHPDKPWTGTTATLTNHIVTDQANVPECFKCHAAGANSTVHPLTTPPAGTAPGCLNDTMCHSTTISSPAGIRILPTMAP
jgi:hypothetical protein